MNTLVLFLLASLAYLPPSHGANSTMRCMSEPKSVKAALKQSAAVFSGEVLEMKNGRNYLEARFRVERSWKGVEAEEVSVLTDSTAESPHYRVGEKYLVFAGIRDGKLFTGNCSRTKKVEYAQGDLQQLGEGKSQKEKQSSCSVRNHRASHRQLVGSEVVARRLRRSARLHTPSSGCCLRNKYSLPSSNWRQADVFIRQRLSFTGHFAFFDSCKFDRATC